MQHESTVFVPEVGMVKMVGSSGQLSLGKQFAGQYYELEHLADGAIVLRPMKVVPSSEGWVHEPEVQYQLAKAAKWLKDTPRTETSIDALVRKGRKRK
jgi:hypothetical protein